LTPKEQADNTVLALKERKRAKDSKKKDIDNFVVSLTIQSIDRRRGRKNLKYFY
jgi:hypothetical protein